jgi:hypothetical protein
MSYVHLAKQMYKLALTPFQNAQPDPFRHSRRAPAEHPPSNAEQPPTNAA